MSHETSHPDNPHKLQLLVGIASTIGIVLVLTILGHFAAMASTMIPADAPQTQQQ